ncbi:MAG: NADH-quinone oxidoreductase subunit I [Roseibacillus sp.]|nr:NADH-quinone oxidoreductase subunit I [Roseibacillus sp.]HAO95926.1 NADH-quinone oxidoreductase subunit I [Verrucomicrobiales bacterium]|tara:strand:- start:1416 stop:1787 length:372 start_codon:yes stop_codon:yes gene_type:complete
MLPDYLPVLMQILVAIGFCASMLIASVVFGKLGRKTGVKDVPYECGMLPIGEGAPRFSVKFYLVAMLFVIFDIEVVFMYPWAVQFKELILTNSMALLSMASFVGILGVAYLYVLKKGALNWKA